MCSFIIDNIEWLILVGISQPKVFTIRRTALAESKKNANKNETLKSGRIFLA